MKAYVLKERHDNPRSSLMWFDFGEHWLVLLSDGSHVWHSKCVMRWLEWDPNVWETLDVGGEHGT